MGQEKHVKTGILGSRYWKAFLVVVAGLFIFGGPYLAYIFVHLLKASTVVSALSGLVSFILGMGLVWYLVKNKVIT
jgi:hypothetical protein